MWDHSFDELFFRGGAVMWPLLVCSVLAMAIILERLTVLFWKADGYRGTERKLRVLLEEGRFEAARRKLHGSRGSLGPVAMEYLEHLDRPKDIREELVAKRASIELSKLERRLNWLSVIAHSAPMLGLLGTVTGLVGAFHQIETAGGQVQPADLAAGIWEALLTTVFGLVIALPALAAYHFFEQRVATVSLHMQWLVAAMNGWLYDHSPHSSAARNGNTQDADDELAGNVALGK